MPVSLKAKTKKAGLTRPARRPAPASRPLLGIRVTDTWGTARVPCIRTGLARLTRLGCLGLGAITTSSSSVSRFSMPLAATVIRWVSSSKSSISACPSPNATCATRQLVSVTFSLCHREESIVGIKSAAHRSIRRPDIWPGPPMMAIRPSMFPSML